MRYSPNSTKPTLYITQSVQTKMQAVRYEECNWDFQWVKRIDHKEWVNQITAESLQEKIFHDFAAHYLHYWLSITHTCCTWGQILQAITCTLFLHVHYIYFLACTKPYHFWSQIFGDDCWHRLVHHESPNVYVQYHNVWKVPLQFQNHFELKV